MRLKSEIYKILNWAFIHLSFERYRSKRKIRSLKDKYAGKRCFVVCNGPSLKAEDLTKIYEAGDISVAMNHIPRIYSQTPWRPNILMCTDGCVFWPKGKELIKKSNDGMKLFQYRDCFRAIGYKGPKLFMNLYGDENLLDHPKFSENLEEIIWSIGTTAYESIEVARWMGCKEIYLIGCDMSYAVNLNRDGTIYYNNSGTNHFYGADKDGLSNVKPVPTWQLKLAFRAADDYSRANGFRVYNATRGGFLEEFERVDFDRLFAK